MADFKWKADQERALAHNKTMALVASAGTGKTTILVEKYARNLLNLISQSDEEPDRALNRMVAITFTEAAAAEMKSRVRSRLHQEESRAREKGDTALSDKLREVVRHFETALISTIHGFCRRLLQDNYLEVGLTPNFQVLDEGLAEQYKQEVVQEVAAEAIANSEFLARFATRFSISSFEESIVSIADQLRADDKEDVSIDEMVSWQEEIWTNSVDELAADLRESFDDYFDLLDDVRTSPNATAAQRDALEGALRGWEVIEPLLQQPERILDEDLPEFLFDKNIVGKHTKGKLIPKDDFKLAYTRLREVIGSDGKAPFSLKKLAGIRKAALPAIRDFLKVTKDYIDRFNSLKLNQDLCDFEDLLLKANRLLRQNADIRQRYQQQFKWIFVDESQDVNAVQMSLIRSLYGDGKHGNLFMVGDGKQSIYKFRYADVRQFNDSVTKIDEQTGDSFSLASNFRSHKDMISSINNIFSKLFNSGENNADESIDYGAPLEAGLENYPATEGQLLELITLSTPTDDDGEKLKASDFNKNRWEGKVIANRIASLIGQPNPASESGAPLEYKDFAILLRSFTSVGDYEIELAGANIPYRVIQGKGFYQQREIWDLICYLKLMWFPEDDYALLTVLRSPICLVSDQTLLALARAHLLRMKDLLQAEELPAGLEKTDHAKLESFLTLFKQAYNNRGAQSTADLLSELLQHSGFDAAYLCKDDGDQRSANIRKFLELAREFESTSNRSPLEFVLHLEEIMFEDKGEPQAPVFDEVENHVRLMTVHRSKGLEFPVVVLPNISNSGRNNTAPVIYEKSVGLGLKIPEQNSYSISQDGSISLVRDISNALEQAESLRLFYVAATRAKSRLLLTAWEDKLQSNNKTINSWLAQLKSIDFHDPEKGDEFGLKHLSDTEIMADKNQIQPQPAAVENCAPEDLNWAREFVGSFGKPLLQGKRSITLGVWQLIYQLFPDLNQVVQTDASLVELVGDEESQGTPAARAGSLVHNWLELNFDRGRHDKASIQSDLIETGMAAAETEKAADAILGFINSAFAAELSQYTILREKSFTAKVVDSQQLEIIVNGVIDVLAVDESGYEIVDYKYAISKDSQEYEYQMMLYALACRLHFGKLPRRATICYLKDGVNKDIQIEEAKLSEFQQLLETRFQN